MYCAIIGDIVKSRDIKERASVQIQLKKALERINVKYSNEIASNFTITIGDEFQGLLYTPKDLLIILDYIKNEIYPIRLRFGIGFGEMSTEINKELAIGADGPAYHFARQAIEEVKKSSLKYEQPKLDILVKTIKLDYSLDLLNATLSTCYFIESRWSEKQREVALRMFLEEKSQRELAVELGVMQSSIQRRLDTAGYFTYKNAKAKINEFMIKIWEGIYE